MQLSEEEQKKREERKARFNVGAATTEMDEKKRQRMERFGIPVKAAKTT